MSKEYKAPTVQVMAAERANGISRLTLQVLNGKDVLGPPFAPASLAKADGSAYPDNLIYELHKCIGQSDQQLIYETYEATNPLPAEALVCILRQWWAADQLEAAADTKANWVYEVYPANGSHEHCLLSWETITAYGDFLHDGYHSEHGWITVEAYRKYIEQDRLRLR